MELRAATLVTPAGPFTLLADDGGICAAGFTGHVELLQRRLDPARRGARARVEPGVPRSGQLGPAAAALRAYLAGDLDALGEVAVTQPGDPVMQAAWQALRRVPAGRTVSYRELAGLAELPADPATDPVAAQAAGAACARNNVAVLVPCHRVLRTGGGLGGYRWGLPRKRWLLAHESGASPRDRAHEAERLPV